MDQGGCLTHKSQSDLLEVWACICQILYVAGTKGHNTGTMGVWKSSETLVCGDRKVKAANKVASIFPGLQVALPKG